jgi:hypothetical protein
MGMRRYLALSAVGACLVLVLTTATTAFAGGSSSTYYVGKNSQGQSLLFSVDHTASGPQFDPFFTTMTTQCPATHSHFTIQFSFSGFQIPIKNGKFSLTLNDLSDRFTWAGTVTPKSASGTQFYDFPAFANGLGLQLCASGSLTWTAKGLMAAAKTAPRGVAYRVSVTKAANGTVHFAVTR